MANKVDADLAELQAAADTTMEVRDVLRTDTASILAQLETLNGQFEGVAAAELNSWKSIVRSELDTVLKRLDEIGEALSESGVNYDDADRLSADNITNQGTLTNALRTGAEDVQAATVALPAQGEEELSPDDIFYSQGMSEAEHVERLSAHPSVIEGNEIAERIAGTGSNSPHVYNTESGPYHEHRGSYEAEFLATPRNPIHLINALYVRQTWDEHTEKLGWHETYSEDSDSGDFKHPGKQNAFRHAYLTAFLVNNGMSRDHAITLGVVHEMDSDKEGEQWGSHDSYTDLVNNDAGAQIGEAYRQMENDGREDLPPLEDFIIDIIENDGENPYGHDLDLTSPKG